MAEKNSTAEMKSAHTEAPWTANIARRIGNYAGGFSIEEDSTGNVICGRAGWPTRAQESEANARLIASAPELLAALRTVHDVFQRHSDFQFGPKGKHFGFDAQVAALIAKAEGGR